MLLERRAAMFEHAAPIVYLLKDGVDQTGEMTYQNGSYDPNGYFSLSGSSGWMLFPKNVATKKYVYFELVAATNASNYNITLSKNGSNWNYKSWYNSNNVKVGNNSQLSYTFLYNSAQNPGTIRSSVDLLTESDITASDSFGIRKSYNTVKVYNVYMSNEQNNFLSPTPYLQT